MWADDGAWKLGTVYERENVCFEPRVVLWFLGILFISFRRENWLQVK